MENLQAQVEFRENLCYSKCGQENLCQTIPHENCISFQLSFCQLLPFLEGCCTSVYLFLASDFSFPCFLSVQENWISSYTMIATVFFINSTQIQLFSTDYNFVLNLNTNSHSSKLAHFSGIDSSPAILFLPHLLFSFNCWPFNYHYTGIFPGWPLTFTIYAILHGPTRRLWTWKSVH